MYSISSITIFLDKASWNRIDSGKSYTLSKQKRRVFLKATASRHTIFDRSLEMFLMACFLHLERQIRMAHTKSCKFWYAHVTLYPLEKWVLVEDIEIRIVFIIEVRLGLVSPFLDLTSSYDITSITIYFSFVTLIIESDNIKISISFK